MEGGGSDLHIASGQTPYGRFSGELRPMRDDALAEEDCNKLIFSMLNNISARPWNKPGNSTVLTA